MRIVDIIYSLPDMLVIILLATVLNQTLTFPAGSALAKLGSNMVSMFIVFGLLYWVGMARLIRGQILSIKENEFVLAARSIGAKPGWIIRKHILPNCLSVIIVSTALQIPVGNLHRELPELHWSRRQRADAVSGLSCKLCASGSSDLSV